MDNEKMVCPMMSRTGAIDCIKTKCAWWNNHYEKCAVVGLGESMQLMLHPLYDISKEGITTYPDLPSVFYVQDAII